MTITSGNNAIPKPETQLFSKLRALLALNRPVTLTSSLPLGPVKC
jgi:hypothetical protein